MNYTIKCWPAVDRSEANYQKTEAQSRLWRYRSWKIEMNNPRCLT